jgi:hypothetical protein
MYCIAFACCALRGVGVMREEGYVSRKGVFDSRFQRINAILQAKGDVQGDLVDWRCFCNAEKLRTAKLRLNK